jgi:hypothetical protein
MAYALVGTIGTASQGAASAAVTPAFGTGESRVLGNLLICFVAISGVATLPTTPSGWSIGKQQAGTSCSATIYYRLAAGADTAPTIAAITSGVIAAQLAEFSGNLAASPLDQTGSASGTGSPLTGTFAAVDALSGELIVMTGADLRSIARASNDTWTSNNATITAAGNNNGATSTNHYSNGYGVTTAKASADTAVMTLSTTNNITGLVLAAASFKVIPPAGPSVQQMAGFFMFT